LWIYPLWIRSSSFDSDFIVVIVIIIIIVIVRLAQFQRVAPLAANNLHSCLSSASLVAPFTLRLWDDRSFFIVASQEV